MRITVTYYLDVISSWCFWAEPAWVELKRRFEGKLEFQWKIALLDKTGLPTSVEQEKWFYRRSGLIMRSPFMLSSAWYDPNHPEYLAPNCVAEAAKDLGITDDRVRLALAHAGDFGITETIERGADGLALRIEDGGFEGDVDAGFHGNSYYSGVRE